MSYYRPPMGDYKTYGYARGDPGFLSGLWKGIKKVALPVLGGIVGGPVGAAIGGLGGSKIQPPPTFPAVGTGGWEITGQGGQPLIGMRRHPGAFPAPGQLQRIPPGCPNPAMAQWMASTPGAIPRGYHLAKDGSGRVVRNRRMNVANPRALRRSMRRVQGFEKLAKRTISFTRRTRMKKRRTST